MDNDELWLFTVYNPEGKRIELRICASLEDTKDLAKVAAESFGEKCIYKIWEAVEVKTK